MAQRRRTVSRRAPARNARRSVARPARRAAVRRSARPARAPARRPAARRGAARPNRQMKIVVELAQTSQVGRPDITEDALRGALVESKKGKAKL